jgi:magnesium transporter
MALDLSRDSGYAGRGVQPGGIVDCATYIDGIRQPGCEDPFEALQLVRETGRGFVWVGLQEPDAEDMAAISWTFGLHELAVEDAIHAHQRAKLEQYKQSLFFVVKTVRHVAHPSPTTASDLIDTGEIMAWLGADFIVTVRHALHSGLRELRQELEADSERLAGGPAIVLHAIADRCVDQYLGVVAATEEDIDAIETAVFSPDEKVGVEQIYFFKREILQLRRATAPLAGPLHKLAETPNPFVPAHVRAYFRDVEDHLAQVTERVQTYSELLSALVNAALAEVSTRQNADMRRISAWAAIALVPTACAGIYGMNFDVMPELRWSFGYPLAIGTMVLICLTLYLVLRRKGWL